LGAAAFFAGVGLTAAGVADLALAAGFTTAVVDFRADVAEAGFTAAGTLAGTATATPPAGRT
jgi:hypothetical protein